MSEQIQSAYDLPDGRNDETLTLVHRGSPMGEDGEDLLGAHVGQAPTLVTLGGRNFRDPPPGAILINRNS